MLTLKIKKSHFNPRAPRGARRGLYLERGQSRNFNPRAPRGARPPSRCRPGRTALFQSTCPARGTTTPASQGCNLRRNFNPRAPRGARHIAAVRFMPALPISIHVPREGHDCIKTYDILWEFCISIHVPREGHDLDTERLRKALEAFQSTCPARGTTKRGLKLSFDIGISIHVPREGHDALVYAYSAVTRGISIHVPREGHDHTQCSVRIPIFEFQSTCPARGTTSSFQKCRPCFTYFNPRAPRGARRRVAISV